MDSDEFVGGDASVMWVPFVPLVGPLLGRVSVSPSRGRRLVGQYVTERGATHNNLTSFGCLRPLHTNAVIFAFGGSALFAECYYVVQRTVISPV